MPIDDPGDPRLEGYRALRDPHLRRRFDRDREVFVAEGLLVLEALVASPYRLRSALVLPAQADRAASLATGVDAPLYVAPAKVLAEVAGFDLHRGVVALGERHPLPDPTAVVRGARLLLVVEGVNDHENLGALYRNAAAFGVDAVLLDPTTADPFYRRCLRVSLGHALRLPTARLSLWPGGLDWLSRQGWAILALTPDLAGIGIDDAVADLSHRDAGPTPQGVAVLVGAEGPGLSEAALQASSVRARIPMAPGVDSINVATAAAVALHQLGAGRLR